MSPLQRTLRVLAGVLIAVGVILAPSAAFADPSPAEVERQLDEAHNQLEDIIEDYNRIGEELAATQASITALNAQMAPLEAQLDSARTNVSRMAATAYKSGGDLRAASFILSATSPNLVVSQVETMDRIARTRQREVSAVSDAKQKFDQERKRLNDLLTAQTQAQAELAAKKAKIEAEVKRLEDIERKLESSNPGRSGGGGNTSPPPPPSGSGKGAVAVRFAISQLGKMYRFGAVGPTNYDCSGLTMAAWKAAGKSLPHNAAMQYRATAKVGRAALVPGDLVYYRGLGHVGIYIGNNQIIHAPRTGKPVQVVSITAVGTPYGYTRPG